MRRHKHDSQPFMSERQRSLLGAVLDTVIPPAGELGGAGELGVGDYVDGAAGISQRALFADGLSAIEVTNAEAHSVDFASLSADRRSAVLKTVETESPEFFEALVHHAYAGYYTDRRALRAKGISAEAPQPQGYAVEPFDPSILEDVKKRGKAFRDA